MLNNSLNGLSFAQDEDGNWGYKVGADSVVPFSSKVNYTNLISLVIYYHYINGITRTWVDCTINGVDYGNIHIDSNTYTRTYDGITIELNNTTLKIDLGDATKKGSVAIKYPSIQGRKFINFESGSFEVEIESTTNAGNNIIILFE